MAPSARMLAKATRILLTGTIRFTELTYTHARCQVIGDGDDYTLSYDSGRYTCPCRHLGECSHILAMSKVLRAVLPALERKGADHGNEDRSGGDNPGGQFFGD